ncbi:hypothetical protein M413DRAFT_447827, partial [Hebeloma cylindrosporum]
MESLFYFVFSRKTIRKHSLTTSCFSENGDTIPQHASSKVAPCFHQYLPLYL